MQFSGTVALSRQRAPTGVTETFYLAGPAADRFVNATLIACCWPCAWVQSPCNLEIWGIPLSNLDKIKVWTAPISDPHKEWGGDILVSHGQIGRWDSLPMSFMGRNK